MTNQVTRCPQCRTSFRITASQIAKARGAVRCGSCLHIFNAEEHRIDADARRDKSKKAKSRKPAPEPAPEQTRLAIDSEPEPAPGGLNFDQAQIDAESGEDDELLISDDMDRADDHNPLFIEETPAAGVSLFERQQREPAEEFIDDSDESWAESLLEDDDDPEPPAEGEPGRYDNPLSIVHTRDEEPEPAPPAEPEPETPEPPQPRFHLAEPEPDDAVTGPATEESDGFFGEKMRAYDSERSELLLGIDPDPVEMSGHHSGPWGRRLLWGGLCLLALIALVGQIGWLQFDRLSRIEPYRGYYQIVCPWVGCELPELRDASQIRAFNLVVRDHPERENALMVDAIILNRANFDQPYPDLRLTFTDMRDEPVATRRFTPDEYLRGELAGSTVMPHNRPVHLTLELVDPGEDAVNYRLDIPTE